MSESWSIDSYEKYLNILQKNNHGEIVTYALLKI